MSEDLTSYFSQGNALLAEYRASSVKQQEVEKMSPDLKSFYEIVFDSLPGHPLVLLTPRSGAFGMQSGDLLLHIPDGKICRADEFLCDGEAFVTFEDGMHGVVKWNSLERIS